MKLSINASLKIKAQILFVLLGSVCLFTLGRSVYAQEINPCGIPQEPSALPQSISSGFLSFRYIQKSIILSGCLRGSRGILKPANFILDTGSNRTLLDKVTAQILELPEVGKSDIVAPGGAVSAAPLVQAEISISDQEYKKLVVSVHDLRQHSRAHQMLIDGILGADFIKEKVLFIDYPNKRVAFLKKPPRLRGLALIAVIPFRVEKDLILVKCSLSKNIQADLIVDTGHILDLQLYEDVSKHLKLPDKISKRKLGGASESHEVTIYKIPSIVLEGYKINNLSIDVHPLVTPNPFSTKYKPGLLGQGILERYIVEINPFTSRIRLYGKRR